MVFRSIVVPPVVSYNLYAGSVVGLGTDEQREAIVRHILGVAADPAAVADRPVPLDADAAAGDGAGADAARGKASKKKAGGKKKSKKKKGGPYLYVRVAEGGATRRG